MCMAGLCVPYWVENSYITGIVVTKVFLGLWVDRVCRGVDPCQDVWRWGGYGKFPSQNTCSTYCIFYDDNNKR